MIGKAFAPTLRVSALSVLATLGLPALASAAPAGDLSGLWNTPIDHGSLIRLETCGEAICGRVVSSPHLRANPDQRDVRNRNSALRGRPLRDLLVLKVRPLGPGRWGDGWAYNPEDGGTYSGTMLLKDDGSLRLTGCILAPFCQTETWTRAE